MSWKRPTGKKVGVALLAFASGLLLVEVAMRVLGYDQRYVNAFASFHVHDSELGMRGKPDFAGRHQNPEFDVRVEHDEKGFRRVRSREAEREVWVFGDSFTWGWGVDQGATYCELLSEELVGVQVRNLGLVGSGQVVQYLLFQNEVSAELDGDDVVLLVIYENDLLENIGRIVQLAHAQVQDGEVEIVPPPRDHAGRQLKNFLKDRSYLGNWIAFSVDRYQALRRAARADREGREYFERQAAGEGPSTEDLVTEDLVLDDDSPQLVVLRHFLELFASEVKAAGAKLGVVCAPGRTAYGEASYDAGAEPYQAARHRAALDTCRELGLPVLDLLPAFTAFKTEHPEQRLTFTYDFHWNAAGHRLVAAAIEPFVKELVAGE